MKNKKFYFYIFLLALLVLVAVFFIPKQNETRQNEVILKLNPLFECGENHKHQNIVWDMSPKEVSKIISIQKDEYRVPPSGSYVAYNSKSECVIAGRCSDLSFEFTDNKLNLMQFYFHIDDSIDTWFAEQVSFLREILGSEMDSVNNSGEMFSSEAYRWDFNDSSVQFAKMTTNSSGKKTIVLSIGKLN